MLVVMLTLLLTTVSTSVFNFSSVKATPGTTIYIRSDGSVDPPTAPIQRDGNIYTFTTDITYPTYEGIVVERSNIIVDGDGYTLEGSGYTEYENGFDLTSVNNVIIRNTNIRDCWHGIWLDSSHFNTICYNTVTNNRYGVFLVGSSSNNDILWNEITLNGQGIDLYEHSDFNTISNNTMSNNTDHGIYLQESSDNIVGWNDMWYNGMDWFCAIWLREADGNSIFSNFLEFNGVGIGLQSSDDNIISDNDIYTGDCGIGLNDLGSSGTESRLNNVYNNFIHGNSIGVTLRNSSSNSFHYNDFIDNTEQVHDFSWDNPEIPPSVNTWDDGYPSGGNYWSDYTGVDDYSGPNQDQPGSDGIGDTPYVIDENNQDNYPLWPSPPVHNLDTGINYTTIQEAIDADETLNGHTIFVEEGTYYEHVVVYKSLSLIGEDRFNTIIDGNFAGCVIEVTADNVNVTGFTVQHCGGGSYDCGIYASSTGNSISDNIITENICGVLLDSSTFSTLSGNNITWNYRGVWLIYSYNNTISGNNITNNEEDGISIAGASRDNTVFGNNIINNDLGVSLWFSGFNYVCRNNISNNNNGVYLYFGYINNTFFHNNFIDNIQQVYIDITPSFPNSWDNGYPSGGNYWSDYTGVDEKSGPNQDQPDSDGIGDTPYTIDAYNQDQYPFMNLHTPQHNIAIKNVTLSKTVVGQGYCINITVIVENQGDYTETFNVTTYYNLTFHDDFESGQKPQWTYYADNPDDSAVVEINEDVYKETPTHSLYIRNLYGNYWGQNNGIAYASLNITELSLTIPYTIEFWFYPNQSAFYPYYNHWLILGSGQDINLMLYDDPDGIRLYDDSGDRFLSYPSFVFQSWHKIKYTRTDANNYILKIDNYTWTGDPYGDSLENISTMLTFGDYRLEFGKGEGYWDDILIYSGLIETKTVTNLPPGEETTLTFTWNTTGFAKGNYTISAVADTVPGETDTADNGKEDGWVIVTWVGDFDGDDDVDAWDGIYFVDAFIDYWTPPVGEVSDPDYWRCDLDGDGDIDGWDGIAFVDAFVEYWS